VRSVLSALEDAHGGAVEIHGEAEPDPDGESDAAPAMPKGPEGSGW
jgi:hypothetical protein